MLLLGGLGMRLGGRKEGVTDGLMGWLELGWFGLGCGIWIGVLGEDEETVAGS